MNEFRTANGAVIKRELEFSDLFEMFAAMTLQN